MFQYLYGDVGALERSVNKGWAVSNDAYPYVRFDYKLKATPTS